MIDETTDLFWKKIASMQKNVGSSLSRPWIDTWRNAFLMIPYRYISTLYKYSEMKDEGNINTTSHCDSTTDVFSHSSGSDRWEPHPCPSARINSAQMMSWDMPYLGLFGGDGEAIEKIGNHQHHNHIEK